MHVMRTHTSGSVNTAKTGVSGVQHSCLLHTNWCERSACALIFQQCRVNFAMLCCWCARGSWKMLDLIPNTLPGERHPDLTMCLISEGVLQCAAFSGHLAPSRPYA